MQEESNGLSLLALSHNGLQVKERRQIPFLCSSLVAEKHKEKRGLRVSLGWPKFGGGGVLIGAEFLSLL